MTDRHPVTSSRKRSAASNGGKSPAKAAAGKAVKAAAPAQPAAQAASAQGRKAPSRNGRRAGDFVELPWERDSFSSTAMSEIMDRSLRAGVARFTAGLSPSALGSAYLDWAIHLSSSPGKRLQLVDKAVRKSVRYGNFLTRAVADPESGPCCIEPLPQDRRFSAPEWQQWPYNAIYQGFLLTQQWWHNATTGVRGVSRQHERVVEFATRQLLDIVAPSNFIPTNPSVLEKTLNTGGQNLVQGWSNLLEDWERSMSGKKPVGAEAYQVGENIAVTPGKVIYRNRLIELIQYTPTTETVQAEPVLIVPAWIMKYYILDLSPQNSLVRYLVEKGHTVFAISWKNPEPTDRDLGMEDYMRLGVADALDAISAICDRRRIHGVGYCLGGTLLSIAAAAMARDGDDRLASLTLLASEVDFTEAGELTLFIDESELSFLEDMMWEQGFLDTKQMAGAFQLLRSNDLIWSRLQHEYLMGERRPMSDLMAWNADLTRMPYRMHSEYLRRLFLDNDFMEGRYLVDGRPVAVNDIRAPIFCVATVRDHVAPWRSVFKMHLIADTEVTFLLTNGGHNTGIVSEPGRPRNSYQVATRSVTAGFIDPDTWIRTVPSKDGSWWPEWEGWLVQRSSGTIPPPAMGAPVKGYDVVCDAPGVYVFQE